MYRLLETIQVRDGILVNAGYHNIRFNASRRELFGQADHRMLEDIIIVPDQFRSGICRCRLLYDGHSHSVGFSPYTFRTIDSLRMVRGDGIDYHLKFADRQILEALFAQRGECDDIIIVKDGCLTDSFAANLLFFDGNHWFTPDTPLLKGTQRANLLDRGEISEARITLRNFLDFQCAGLINAFSGLNNMQTIPIKNIVPH
jgi:4-amino-4-deoxychorismate lyase